MYAQLERGELFQAKGIDALQQLVTREQQRRSLGAHGERQPLACLTKKRQGRADRLAHPLAPGAQIGGHSRDSREGRILGRRRKRAVQLRGARREGAYQRKIRTVRIGGERLAGPLIT